MSRHIAPHRWADALRAEVDADELTAMEAHAAACKRCAGERRRIRTASDTFPVLREQPTPELGWDGVRARIHWTISKEKRDTASHPKLSARRLRAAASSRFGASGASGPAWRRWPAIAAATALVAAGSVAVYSRVRAPAHPAPHVAAAHAPEVAPPAPAALTALVSRLAGDVMIDGARVPLDDAFARPLGAGTVLATGAGRIDVQFGEASVFALGPRSTLELRTFDARTITLVVDGTVDLEVAPRAPHQRFFVVAGDRTVEVRGTRFAVKHDASGTLVSCQHGLVAVRDGLPPAPAAMAAAASGSPAAMAPAAAASGSPAADAVAELEVGTARKAFLPADHRAADVRAVPLTADELARLATSTPWSTPGWNPDLSARTAPLEVVTAVADRAVRVDGIELGAAPFAMRVAPGRHTIEAADTTGRFRRAGWVDVAAPTAGGRAARFEAPLIDEAPVAAAGAANPAASATGRKLQFDRGIDRARLRQCTRRLAKSGLTDTFVQIEITVDAAGALNVLNIIDTDLPADTAGCVHDALSDVKFPAGAAATWREKLTL